MEIISPQEFAANSDRNTRVVNRLQQPLLARYVRLKITGWQNRISMRFELYGCSIVSELCPRELAIAGPPFIPDRLITANGFTEDYEPWKCRIGYGPGWVAAEPYTPDMDYIQVQFDV